MEKFKLNEKQIEYLKREYPNSELVQRVLSTQKDTTFEIDVDTSSYRLATRFAKFHNLPELTSLLSSVADFHQVDESAGQTASQ